MDFSRRMMLGALGVYWAGNDGRQAISDEEKQLAIAQGRRLARLARQLGQASGA